MICHDFKQLVRFSIKHRLAAGALDHVPLQAALILASYQDFEVRAQILLLLDLDRAPF